MKALRGTVWLIVAAALLPLALFVVLQRGFEAQKERELVEARALHRAERVLAEADGEFGRIAAALAALPLDADTGRLSQRASDLRARSPGWVWIGVEERGRLAFASDRAERTVQALAATARSPTRLTGLVRGPGCPCLRLERSAGSGRTFQLLVDHRLFLDLLGPGGGQYEVSAIVTPDGRFVARNVDAAQRFGTPASTYLRQAAAGGRPSGIYRGVTLEGFENYSAFARSPETGLSVHVAFAVGEVDDPARRFGLSLGAAALLSLTLAGALLAFALRQMAQARKIAERLEQSQKLEALGQLTGGIAHDFNNLLTPIVGALDILAKRPDLDARGKRLAAGALASAEKAAKLTQQMLAFSRRQRMVIEPIDIGAMLADMAGLIEQSVGKTHRVTIDCPEPAPCAMSDVTQLELAILNLLLNARDCAPAGSEIHLGVDPAGEWVRISVCDQGSGMSPEVRRRATEPFFSTKPQGKGTGLGLPQVVGVAEQSGGDVQIESAPGKGTTVTIRLRACERAEPDAPADPVFASSPALRLLLVDDDQAVREMIALQLVEAGHQVNVAGSAAEALAILEGEGADLMITDYAMPLMTGAELIAAVRARWPAVRFLMISGYADSDEIAELAPGVPLLKKPITADALAVMVARAMAD